MGGIVVFQWEKQQLTLLQNRDNWEKRLIKAAAWDEKNQMLAGRCEVSCGSWFSVSKNGRVAFLVDSGLMYNGRGVNDESGFGLETLTIDFLKSKSSPKEYAKDLELIQKESEDDERGLTFNLIVADITSESMYYICKPSEDKPVIEIQEVAFGVHTLSSDGLDDTTSAKDIRLRDLYNSEVISLYKDRELPSLKELASKFMYDREEAVVGKFLTALFVEHMDQPAVPVDDDEMQRYGTTSTTVCVVKPTKEVMFYERHYEHGGEWTHHDFTFNINA